MTEAEKFLWSKIRKKQINNLQFYRQRPIGKYVVDFFCPKKKLIIELDGGEHANNKRDKIRDKWLKGQGYKVIRIWNDEIFKNIEGVIETIIRECK